MSTKEATLHDGRRRSARLAQAVAIEIAGKGPDGKIFVESTTTREISQNGASLLTRH